MASEARDTRIAVARGVGVTVIVASLVFAYYLWRASHDATDGPPLYDTHATQGLNDALKIVVDSYTDLIKLAATAFGAVAFLVTYQQKSGAVTTRSAWTFLGVGLICLLSALLFSLIGREALLIMIGHNVVVLGLESLAFGRLVIYVSWSLGALALGLFALDVALAPRGSTPSPDS